MEGFGIKGWRQQNPSPNRLDLGEGGGCGRGRRREETLAGGVLGPWEDPIRLIKQGTVLAGMGLGEKDA